MTFVSTVLAIFFNTFINPIALEKIGWKYYIVFAVVWPNRLLILPRHSRSFLRTDGRYLRRRRRRSGSCGRDSREESEYRRGAEDPYVDFRERGYAAFSGKGIGCGNNSNVKHTGRTLEERMRKGEREAKAVAVYVQISGARSLQIRSYSLRANLPWKSNHP